MSKLVVEDKSGDQVSPLESSIINDCEIVDALVGDVHCGMTKG
jgi:hypothetical protein